MTTTDDLAIARSLAEAGVPIFLARRADTFPFGGHRDTGYLFPRRWQETAADPAALDAYEPGMAVCAVGGHGVDFLDIDVHKRGAESLAGMNGTRPRVYGKQRTPSGGQHDLIASIGARSRDGFRPGLDFKGGVGGKGLGFVFLAPTEKRSKVDGVVRPYSWGQPPDLAGVDRDDSGAALAQELMRLHDDRVEYDGPGYDDLPADRRAWADRYVAEFADRWRGRLADVLRLPEGETDGHGHGWERAATNCAFEFMRVALAPWSGWDLDDAKEAYERALPPAIADNPDCGGKWDDGRVSRAAGEPCWEAPWASAEGDFTPVADDADADRAAAPGGGNGNGGPPLAVRLRQRVEAAYDVFPASDDGRIFVQPKGGGRAELLTGGFVIRAARGVGSQAGTLSAAAAEAAKVLAALAEASPPRRLALRVHRAPGRIVLDLAQPGTSRCAVVTAEGWSVEDVPPPGVAFQSASGKALPEPERGGSLDDLRRVLRWDEDDPRWPLVKGWLPCSLLADVPRPLLGLFGPQGSAKSTTGRFVVDLVDPKPSGALGSGFGKNRSDDETKAFASYLVAWDNVSKVSDEGADLLSRLVTGDMIEKRRLYTDADVATIVYRRTGVLTGISVPRGVKADTLDRLILLALAPLAERRSESALEEEWAAARPRALAGVLDLAVRMLAGERRNPDRLRMADYAEALWAIDPALYRAYAANVREAREEMAGNDPLIATIRAWLSAQDGHRWEGSATDARRAAEWHKVEEMNWWPGNGRAFMDAVTANLELLREVGVAVAERRSNGRRIKCFELTGPPDDPGTLL